MVVAHRGRRRRAARRRLRDGRADCRRMGGQAGRAARGVGVRRAAAPEGASHSAGALPLSVHCAPTAGRIRGGGADSERCRRAGCDGESTRVPAKSQRRQPTRSIGLVADDLERVPFVYVRKKAGRRPSITRSVPDRRRARQLRARQPPPFGETETAMAGMITLLIVLGSRAVRLLAHAAAVLQRAALGCRADGRVLPDASAHPRAAPAARRSPPRSPRCSSFC